MGLIIVGWVFVTFLYFKVAFEFAYYTGITTIGSILLAIIFGLFVFFVSGIYSARLLSYNWSQDKVPADSYELIGKTFYHLLAAFISYAIIDYLVIFGFSERLSRSIDSDALPYLIVIITPIVVHYAMCIFSTYKNCNLPSDMT